MSSRNVQVSHSRGPGVTPRHVRVVGGNLLAVLVAIGVAAWLGPQPMHLGFQTGGDQALADTVRRTLGSDGSHLSTTGYRSLAVATVSGSATQFTGLGNRGDGSAPTSDTPFEIGSITKLFTGLMLADAVDRGEVRLSDSLVEYLPTLTGTEAGRVTLLELATHRSGLPAYADEESAATYEGSGSSDVENFTVADVIALTGGLWLSGEGLHNYSNLGVTLLGQALAVAAKAPSWEALVTERILTPAGMRHTSFAASTSQVPTGAAVGSHRNGSRTPFSVGPGYFPAGTATFSTTSDLVAFAQWVMDRRAIGLWALTPLYPVSDGDSVGLLWRTTNTSTGTRSWHNGTVPGFNSVLRLDVPNRRAVVILGNTDASVDLLGNLLLDPESGVDYRSRWFDGLIALVSGLLIVACVFVAGRLARWYVVVAVTLVAAGGMVYLLRYSAWQNLPGWIWAVGAAGVGLAAVLGASRGGHRHVTLPLALGVGIVSALAFNSIALWIAG